MTRYHDAYASAITKVPEDNEVPVTVARDKENTQKTLEYVSKMYLDVTNIDQMIKIHEGPSTRKLMHITLNRLNYSPNSYISL